LTSFLSYARSSLLGYRESAAQGDYALVAYDVDGRYRLVQIPQNAVLYVVGNSAPRRAVGEEVLNGRCLVLKEDYTSPPGKFEKPPDEAARLVAGGTSSAAVGAFEVEVAPENLRGLTALAVLSDVGRVRRNNEDSGFTASVKVSCSGSTRVYWLIGVADGAGGHEYGELASSEAVLEFLSVTLPGLAEGEGIPNLIREGFEAANRRVLELIRSRGATMASTLSVAIAEAHTRTVHIGHVGDSRIYMVYREHARRLTTDHKPPTGPRNVITNALGLPSMWVELHAGAGGFRLEPGAILLASTDGLTELVNDNEISRVVRKLANAPWSLCRELINLANSRGGYDNITVAVMTQLA